MEARELARLTEDFAARSERTRRLVRHLVADDDVAADVVQDAWLVTLRQPAERVYDLGRWLSGVARRRALKLQRENGHRRMREERVARLGSLPAADHAPERAELQRALARVLLDLDEPYRSVILLRYLRELSIAEIAQRLHRPKGTVQCQIKRGLERLRAALDRRYDDRRASWLSSLVLLLPERERSALEGAAVTSAAGFSVRASAVVAVFALVSGTLVWLNRDARDARPGLPVARALAAAPSAGTKGLVEPAPSSLRRSSSTSPAAASFGRFALRVVTDDGAGGERPVAGLGVRLVEADGTGAARSSTTAANGTWALDDLAPGLWSLQPARGAATRFALAAGQLVEHTLRVPRTVTVRGTVRTVRLLDLAESPAHEAEIWVSPPGRAVRGHIAGRSDAEGRFELANVDPDAWLWAERSRLGSTRLFHVGSARGSGKDGSVQLDLTVFGVSNYVSGRVVDTEGLPLAGAEIVLEFAEARALRTSADGLRSLTPLPARTTTDADGRYSLTKFRISRNRVTVHAEGYRVQRGMTNEYFRFPETVDFVLERESQRGPRSVAGHALSADGEPWPNACLELAFDSTGGSTRMAKSDENGRFELSLPPGIERFDLRAYDQPGLEALPRAVLRGLGPSNALVVRARAVEDDARLSGETPVALRLSSRELARPLVIPAGDFDLEALPPGEHELASIGTSSELCIDEFRTLARGEHAELGLLRPALSGSLTLDVAKTTGAPVVTMSVLLTDGRRSWNGRLFEMGDRVRLTPDGRASADLPPGRYDLWVHARGHASEHREVWIREGETTALSVTLASGRPGILTLVFPPGEEAVPSGLLRARLADGWWELPLPPLDAHAGWPLDLSIHAPLEATELVAETNGGLRGSLLVPALVDGPPGLLAIELSR